MRFTSFVKIEKERIRFRADPAGEELELNINFEAADANKVVDRYEKLIRSVIHDSYHIWHAAE